MNSRRNLLYSPTKLLDAVNKYLSDIRIAPLSIEHRVIQVAIRPTQLKILLDERGAISVDRVNVLYRLVLGYSSSDQSVDLRVARGVEKRAKHILAIAKKILRAAANDYAWAARKRQIDRPLGDDRDSPCIKAFQAIGWRQAPLECPPEKRFKDAINCRIIFPFPSLDRLRRTVGQPRDFLSEFVVPQLPTQKFGQLRSNLRTAAAKFTFDRYGLNHHDNA